MNIKNDDIIVTPNMEEPMNIENDDIIVTPNMEEPMNIENDDIMVMSGSSYILLEGENDMCMSGASPGFGRGGANNFFFLDLEICMSRSDMLRMAKPCAMLGGFGGMLPRENFLKWCNLVRFGVYFDQIWSLKNFNNYHFYIKILKIAIFYIKE